MRAEFGQIQPGIIDPARGGQIPAIANLPIAVYPLQSFKTILRGQGHVGFFLFSGEVYVVVVAGGDGESRRPCERIGR